MGVKEYFQNTGRLLTENIPKAILCVPDKRRISTDVQNNSSTSDQINAMIDASDNLKKSLIGSGNSMVQTFSDLTKVVGGNTKSAVQKWNYLALEVQYNPSSVYLETVAGSQMSVSGSTMGDATNQQMRTNVEPTATTLSVQLLFDAVNAQDSFMMSNLAPTVGNAVTAVSNLAKGDYSVKPQMDGIMSLLTLAYTRQVLFFWSKMCFQGELSSVSSHYKMFNTKGNPVRGEIRLTIRQEENPRAKYENQYWQKAFDKAFGDSMFSGLTKSVSTTTSVLNNSVLNLNI